jgi:pimeloyl-ACP methyl ester carboxylesterase
LKSSSLLFPVELSSAEEREGFYEDLYSLKPNRSRDKTVEIALVHLHTQKDSTNQKQILFVHDAFQSHWQWMDGGVFQEVIDNLLKQGYSIWLMDWRAHGSSKKNRIPKLNTILDMATNDLTAVVEFVLEKNRNELVIVSKGYGAKMTLLCLPVFSKVKQFVFLDAISVFPSRKFWIPGVRIIKWAKLAGKDWVNGEGSEAESASLFREPLLTGGWLGLFRRPHNTLVHESLEKHAAKISWLCSNGRFERIGKRLAKKQARIHRVRGDQIVSEFDKLISSQSV